MANRRTPTPKALVSGAEIKNPARLKDRLASVNGRKPLGDPPERLNEAEREAWRDFADTLPWLARPHRAIVELTCRLRVRIESGEVWGVNAVSAYSSMLSKLGASPIDDSRVHWPADEEADDLDHFFN
jgi:hypothetical protein